MTTEAETDQARVSELHDLRRASGGRRFAANAIKIHVDGMIDLRTAAVLEPYSLETISRADLVFSGTQTTIRIASISWRFS